MLEGVPVSLIIRKVMQNHIKLSYLSVIDDDLNDSAFFGNLGTTEGNITEMYLIVFQLLPQTIWIICWNQLACSCYVLFRF